jgi:hypothetical protein
VHGILSLSFRSKVKYCYLDESNKIEPFSIFLGLEGLIFSNLSTDLKSNIGWFVPSAAKSIFSFPINLPSIQKP